MGIDVPYFGSCCTSVEYILAGYACEDKDAGIAYSQYEIPRFTRDDSVWELEKRVKGRQLRCLPFTPTPYYWRIVIPKRSEGSHNYQRTLGRTTMIVMPIFNRTMISAFAGFFVICLFGFYANIFFNKQ